MQTVIIAGDCGVYLGDVESIAACGSDGRVELHNAQHLRTYVVRGRMGSGSAADAAVLGLEPPLPLIVPGVSVLLGVRRIFPCNWERP